MKKTTAFITVPEKDISIYIYNIETSKYNKKDLDYYLSLDDNETIIDKKKVLFDNEIGLLATIESRDLEMEKHDSTFPSTFYCEGIFEHEDNLYFITFYLHDYQNEDSKNFVDDYISNYIKIQ